ncbi:MAG: hypothetical protein Q8L00_01205, partial [Deltaproteobacteria bacterium]|nr:hypothetical protein [Deltaproteobacteria bacterium]
MRKWPGVRGQGPGARGQLYENAVERIIAADFSLPAHRLESLCHLLGCDLVSEIAQYYDDLAKVTVTVVGRERTRLTPAGNSTKTARRWRPGDKFR